ncbi:MAG: hypothetical protein Dbin4_02696 [Alphaproteobacteria bacterium]|nr:hypothetical protein [Alphaproteobacteria bacterium]
MTADCPSHCEFVTHTLVSGNYQQACLTCGVKGEWYRPDGTNDVIGNILSEVGYTPTLPLARPAIGLKPRGI